MHDLQPCDRGSLAHAGVTTHQESELITAVLREGWSLHQRLAVAPHVGALSGGLAADISQVEAWRRAVAPDFPHHLEWRLAWDGHDLTTAAAVLQPNRAAVPSAPAWLPRLEGLRQAAQQAKRDDQMGPTQLQNRCQNLPFWHVWRPVADQALLELRERCASRDGLSWVADSAWIDLQHSLLQRLCRISRQALWDLFNLRRTPGQMLQAHLDAGTDGPQRISAQLYHTFVHGLHVSGYHELLATFPVLGRLVAGVVEDWIAAADELLQRIASDRRAIQHGFGVAQTSHLAHVNLDLADPHNCGRTVTMLIFADGDAKVQLIYKPRDLRLDEAFQSILQLLNGWSELEPLREVSVLLCGNYGYMGYVEHELCSDSEDLSRFYFNAGRLLAILYLLGCTDCYYENLIVSARQLVLVDAETLFEPDLHDLQSQTGLDSVLQASVLRTGLLPYWRHLGPAGQGPVDTSALGMDPPPAVVEQPSWHAINTDAMLPMRSPLPAPLPSSLPYGHGGTNQLPRYVDELCDGFVVQLEVVLEHGDSFCHALDRFKGLVRRLVVRPTAVYAAIQQQMLSPAALRSGVAHGLVLEQLARSYLFREKRPCHWPLFAAECRQMEGLDVPFFQHRVDAELIPLSAPQTVVSGLIARSGYCAALRRIEALDPAAIAFQRQLIRGVIEARFPNQRTTVEAPGRRRSASSSSPRCTVAAASMPEQRFSAQAEACRLCDELWTAAIPDPAGAPQWLGLDLGSNGGAFHFGLVGPSLYSGTSGMALLFARRAQLCGQGGDLEAARLWHTRSWACLHQLEELVVPAQWERLYRLVRDQPLGLAGLGGVLLAAQLLSPALPEASGLGDALLRQLRPERLRDDTLLDVIGGVAGLMGPLLQHGSDRALELAVLGGDQLLAQQRDGGGWLPGERGPVSGRRRPLTGFSHGAAGIAAALGRLAQVTGELRFNQGAQRAIAYERSVFVPARANWPDLRGSGEEQRFMLSWCHGAPGILLSRLILSQVGLADSSLAAELEVARTTSIAALEAVAAAEQPLSHLCCGGLGLSTVLRIDSLVSGIPLHPAVAQAERALMRAARAQTVDRAQGVAGTVSTRPGLFTGKAGIALALMERDCGLQWIPIVLSAGLLRALPRCE